MLMRETRKRLISIALAFVIAAIGGFVWLNHASAQTDEGFSLQVSPSPLVATIKSGAETTLELQIRNTNASAQALKMDLRPFSIDSATGEVKLGDTVSEDIKSLVTFESPTFTLEAGQIFTQRIHVSADKNKGFSYNFAVTISQQNPLQGTNGKSAIRGSVAVFTLISIDKPGATRKVELQSLSVDKHSYEYLPANITVSLKNTGNTNVQPAGTVFIQRHADDTKSIASIALNDAGGYVLPGASRTFTVSWNDGFPHYENIENGTTTKRKLVWHASDLSKIRIGRYVAKVVAIYDDGQRDVPIMAEISFWVIPWRFILGALLILVILIAGIVATIRSFTRAARHASDKIRHTTEKEHRHDS